jgi:hypothetical protein
MGKIPVRIKVYDNGWKYGMYIGATLGGSGILSALPGIIAPDEYVFSGAALIWGIIGLVIFLISKYLNSESAKKGNY